jgi:hypothetical protein
MMLGLNNLDCSVLPRSLLTSRLLFLAELLESRIATQRIEH